MKNKWLINSHENKIITEKLWFVFNILRGSIQTSKYHIILFFLTIYKDGLLDNLAVEKYESKRILVDRINNSDEYYEIAKIYLPIIEILDNRQVNELIDLFSSFDRNYIKKDFDSIFEYFLYEIFDVIGVKEQGILQPIELTQLINEISEIRNCEKIYNPFAGLASFGINLNDKQSYYGQELNQSTWAIGKLRLMANGFNKPVEYKNENSIDIWPENERFDLIVSFPPMGAKLRYMNSIHHNEYSTVEQFLIENGISSLNHKGKLISILPLNFLYKSGYEQTIRERIVNEDLLDMIILMPSGLLKHTITPFCIFILNKAKSNSGIVRFINAQKYISNDNTRNKRLDVQPLIELIKDGNDNDSLKNIDNSFIRENNYNLNVIKYFTKEYSGINIFQEYCYFFDSNRSNEREKGKYVRIRDLKNDIIDNKIDIANVEDVDIPKYAKRIEESCLLVARLGRNLKPTYFNYKGVPIYISNDIYSIKVNQENLNIDYLINELLSDDVTEQLDSFRLGLIPSLKKNDFLNIRINIISIEEQNAKVKGLYELSSQIKLLQEERNSVVQESKINKYNEFASLKHSIGAPRQNILSNSKTLIRFFERNQSDAFKQVNDIFKETYNIELIEVFKQIKDDINHISTILEKGEKGLILEDFPNELISLKQINGFVNEISENGNNFYLRKNIISNYDLNNNGIVCNLTLMRVLFDNILNNANKYGFKEKTSTNEVFIDLQVFDDLLELTIKNNGATFPKNYTQEKFIAKYNTAHSEKGTGIGGYDINRIAGYFGNEDWILELNESAIYPVIFKFAFEIKYMK